MRSLRTLGLACAIAISDAGATLGADNPPEVPVVDAGIGACRADFTVKDEAGKPLYNAKISVSIKSGFLNRKKTELEVGTNSDGKARVTGLPAMPKKPLEFEIKSGTVSKSVTDDPSATCNAVYDVTLSVH
jgi:hypothetical protein